jgi:hypothetical protein
MLRHEHAVGTVELHHGIGIGLVQRILILRKYRGERPISLFGHAPEVQVSRWGLPMVTHIFLNDPSDQEVKEQFNASVPSEDLRALREADRGFCGEDDDLCRFGGGPG